MTSREPVQIVEMIVPKCANTFGTAPCMASGTGDTKCYNTRATCQDAANYRISPEGGLGTPDVEQARNGVLTSGDFTRNSDVTFAVDLAFSSDANGCIAEIGSGYTSMYLGVTSGKLVFRVGGGGTGHPSNTAKVSVSVSTLDGKGGTLIAYVDMSANNATLGFFDASEKTYTELGSNTASGSFTYSLWAGPGDGGVGYVNGDTAAGESTANYSEKLTEFRAYNSVLPWPITTFTDSLYFSRGNVADRGVVNAIPSLASVTTSPTRINMNQASPDARGLGNRAVATVKFHDHQYSDLLTDPYLSGRSWNPMDKERGSFWARWVVRHKYHLGMRLKIYEGYTGEALADMRTREYFVTEISGPDSSGTVTMRGKDALARIEHRKAKCPRASPGVLANPIDAVATTINIARAQTSDYPSSGILRIDDEIVTYTGTALVGGNLVISGVSRAQYDTDASEHANAATVQECVKFDPQPIDDLLETLLVEYGGIELGWLDRAAWETEATDYLGFYQPSALITEPTAVEDLVSELQTQCLFYVWWSERNSTIRMAAITALRSTIPTITDARHIVAGSYARKEHEKQRLSQVWVHFEQTDYVENPKTAKAYNTTVIVIDQDQETDALYGEPSVKQIHSRWLRSEVLARNTARKILIRQKDPPETISFKLDAKDRSIWTGDKIYLDHYADVDQYGARRLRIWTIVSAEEVVPGEIVQYEAENTTAYGISNFVMASGTADYPGYASAPAKNCYIGNAAGRLSDGAQAGKIT